MKEAKPKKKIKQLISAKQAFKKIKPCRAGKYALFLEKMVDDVEYTGQQLYKMTGLTPNLISARLSEMREHKLVIQSEVRIYCPISKHLVYTHRKPSRQMDLLA